MSDTDGSATGSELHQHASELARANVLYDELRRQIEAHEVFSGTHAAKFSNVYYLFRPTALILAVVTTAVAGFLSPKNPVTALLAAAVAIVTALDSWLPCC